MALFLDHAVRALQEAARSSAGGTGEGRALTGLPEPALAWTLARAFPRSAWVVVPTQDGAERLFRLLSCFRGSRGETCLYPQDDLPPYAGVSPHPELVHARLHALDAVSRGAMVVASATSLLPRVMTPSCLGDAALEIQPGQRWARRDLLGRLTDLGYLSAAVVEDPGTFAARGEILDVWPTGATLPARVDFFDQEVESIRAFDPGDQKKRVLLASVRILPARDWLHDTDLPGRFLERTRSAVGSDPVAAALRRRLQETLKARLSFAGAEDWLPALVDVGSALAHGPGAPRVVVDLPRILEEAARGWDLALRRFGEMADDERPLVPPESRFFPPQKLEQGLAGAARVLTTPPLVVTPGHEPLDAGLLDNASLRVGRGDLAPLVRTLKDLLDQDWRTVLVCSGSADAERTRALLSPHGLRPVPYGSDALDKVPPGSLSLTLGPLEAGFRAPLDRWAVLCSEEIFVSRERAPARKAVSAFRKTLSVGFGSLKEKDLVVHAFHGIGEYLGMARLAVSGVDTDFLRLAYRGGDVLYVPVHKLDQLSRYKPASEGVRPALDRLGGQSWRNRRTRVRDAMVKTAHDLLEIHARRAVVERPPLPREGTFYARFEANFPYEETPDQGQAIAEVMEDLRGNRPMDRVVVGDVGFGKTEVAMRAAARFVELGRQVAVLCPTTVLAFQHHQTWKERFEGLPVRVGMLSRLTDLAESRALVKDVGEGKVQILIGTTRLLTAGLRFQDLGLMVVDEEHRFGVRQKEQIKKLRAEIDLLSLSATPIPRTLHLALSGVRAFSVITSPPPDRLAIRTRIAPFDAQVIREEILAELARGGQVFFVHNRVQSIHAMARFLGRLLPELAPPGEGEGGPAQPVRIAVTHGQMDPEELERSLIRFVRKQADILVTTSIIESGVDLPNVNLVLVNRADRFGLAQLYQIRGRVGRSFRRARCVLLVPNESTLSTKAVRRLRVLQEHQELGAGFAVASADMEMRGPGTLLGDSQHGHVDAVGFDTYVELLDEAMTLARGDLLRKRLDPEIEVPVPAYVPESYLPGVAERLEEYRRLSLCETPADVRDYLDDMEDRLGPAPEELLNLGWLLETRLRCRALGIARICWLKVRVDVHLAEETLVTPTHAATVLRKASGRVPGLGGEARLEVVAAQTGAPAGGGTTKFRFRFTEEEAQAPFRFLHWVLRLFEAAAEEDRK